MIKLIKPAVACRTALVIGGVLGCSLLRLAWRNPGEAPLSGVDPEALESRLPAGFPAGTSGGPGAGEAVAKGGRTLGAEASTVKKVRSLQTESAIMEVDSRAMAQRLEEIVAGDGGKQKLMRNGVAVFEGYSLGDASVSSQGAVALAAHDSKLKPAARAEEDSDFKDGRWQVGISEVWLVENGRSEKISRPGVHAEHPCISQDGSRVAYTSQPLDGSGSPGRLSLAVYDTRTKRTATVPIASRGRVVPLLWEDGNLAVYNGGWESMEKAEVAFLRITP